MTTPSVFTITSSEPVATSDWFYGTCDIAPGEGDNVIVTFNQGGEDVTGVVTTRFIGEPNPTGITVVFTYDQSAGRTYCYGAEYKPETPFTVYLYWSTNQKAWHSRSDQSAVNTGSYTFFRVGPREGDPAVPPPVYLPKKQYVRF